LDTGAPQGLRVVQGERYWVFGLCPSSEFVTHHTSGTPGSIRATCTRHMRLHVRHGCRAAATRQERLGAHHLLPQENQP
jgi:hypothetical protein